MIVTETVNIDYDSTNISLEDLTKICEISWYNSNEVIVTKLIVMRKVVDYLKLHPGSSFSTLTPNTIISQVISKCVQMSYSYSNQEEYNQFKSRYFGRERYPTYGNHERLFCFIDRAIRILERNNITNHE